MSADNNNKRFGRVAVLMGGSSAEREISLQSGQAVYQALKNKGVNVVALDTCEKDLEKLRDFDRAFIALHGRGGEEWRSRGRGADSSDRPGRR